MIKPRSVQRWSRTYDRTNLCRTAHQTFLRRIFRLGAVLRVGRAFGFRNVSVDMDTLPNADGGCADP